MKRTIKRLCRRAAKRLTRAGRWHRALERNAACYHQIIWDSYDRRVSMAELRERQAQADRNRRRLRKLAERWRIVG